MIIKKEIWVCDKCRYISNVLITECPACSHKEKWFFPNTTLHNNPLADGKVIKYTMTDAKLGKHTYI